jgi:hypothetical protein
MGWVVGPERDRYPLGVRGLTGLPCSVAHRAETCPRRAFAKARPFDTTSTHPCACPRHSRVLPRHPHSGQPGCPRGSPARAHPFTRRVAARVDCDTASAASRRPTARSTRISIVMVARIPAIRDAIHRIGLAHARHRCPRVSSWAYASAQGSGPSAQRVGASASWTRRSLGMPWLRHWYSLAHPRDAGGHPSGWAHASAGRTFASARVTRACVAMDASIARHRCPNAWHIAHAFRVCARPNRGMRMLMTHDASGHRADAFGHPEDASAHPRAGPCAYRGMFVRGPRVHAGIERDATTYPPYTRLGATGQLRREWVVFVLLVHWARCVWGFQL